MRSLLLRGLGQSWTRKVTHDDFVIVLLLVPADLARVAGHSAGAGGGMRFWRRFEPRFWRATSLSKFVPRQAGEDRSPGFASEQDIDDVQSVKVYTSCIPAEFGRKLGGVVETVSERNAPSGFHGTVLLGGGSFDTQTGYLGASYVRGRNALAWAPVPLTAGFPSMALRTQRDENVLKIVT